METSFHKTFHCFKSSLLFFQGNFTRITLRQHLYIGGYDKLSLIHDRLGTGKGFVGCVEQLIINDYMYDMREDNRIIGDTQFGLNVGKLHSLT